LEITNRAVVALNLMDEARRAKLTVDDRRLARDLGVPVVPMAARSEEGLPDLLQTIHQITTGQTVGKPHRIKNRHQKLNQAINALVVKIEALFPGLPNARWVAMRLLDGDERIIHAVQRGELGDSRPGEAQANSPQILLEVA